MKKRSFFHAGCGALVIAGAVWLTACQPAAPTTTSSGHGDGGHEAHGDQGGHEGHDHGSEGDGAKFEAGKGIILADETKKALKLETVEVTSTKIARTLKLSAHVYRAAREPSLPSGRSRQGIAYASAMIPAADAAAWKEGRAVTVQAGDATMPATIARFDRQLEGTTGQVEAIVEVPDAANRLKVGEFVTCEMVLPGSEKEVLSIPASAVLRSTQGTFVFTQNGRYYLRTAVVLGPSNGTSIEVKDGLYEGDVVVDKAVETLWLIELRATKGGGHSHG